MKHDYIPLAQDPTTASRLLAEPASPRSRWSSRRRAILGSTFVIALVAFYFIAAELADYADDLYDDDRELVLESDAAYLPFEPPRQNNSSRPGDADIPLTPTQELPDHCRDAFFSEGALCFDPDIQPMDVVWTWVNGSDTLLEEAKLRTESQFASDDPYRPKSSAAQARQYRDNDELRHSMRSVLDNFRPFTNQFHLITSDFRMPVELVNTNGSFPADWRLGQVPQWIDLSKKEWRDENVDLDIIHHADIFRPYQDTNFNSYAIESQFGHLQDVSEHFIYLNDDFYMRNPLTPRTFWTSAYGIVIRFDLGIMVSPNKPSPDEEHGEWRSMGESNVLLSDRFGARYRPYVLHEAKAVSMSLLREITAMWAPQLASAATHPFRETVSGSGDVSMLFLMAHFIIERWREALLWSWTIAKHGGLHDEWDETMTARVWAELGGEVGQKELHVKAGYRETLEDDRVKAYFKASGHRKSDKTWYQFASGDGYPYAYVDGDHHSGWPSFRTYESEESLPECTMSFDECFVDDGKEFTAASDVFKHIAFKKPKCGDCIIQSLVAASGSLGLEAFLPSHDRRLPTRKGRLFARPGTEKVPHLPMDASWQTADFSLVSVMDIARGFKVREWTLKLLQRYRFVIGYTPYAFVMLETMDNAKGALGWIDSYADASLLCINDDVKPGEEDVSDYFRSWQENRWSKPAGWERPPSS